MSPEERKDDSSTEAASRRVLVTDDNPDGAETLAIVLRLAGHDVRVAHDGPSTLEIAAEYKPHVVFIDLGMPGMDGFETARQLRQNPELEKTVLVALTGYGREEDRQRAVEAGLDHFVVKPAAPKLLSELASQTRRPR